ncbi:MAG: hypothetical protein ABIG42_00845 [bacterium]
MNIKIIRIGLFVLLSLCVISCTGKTAKSPEIKKTVSDEKLEESSNSITQQYIKNLTDESIKDAHIFLPEYPGALIDESKGSFSKTEMGESYNLVYHTDDSVSEVVDFFHSKISKEYITETSDPESNDWVHMVYEVESLNHGGSIFVRKTQENTTEIIYELHIDKTGLKEGK